MGSVSPVLVSVSDCPPPDEGFIDTISHVFSDALQVGVDRAPLRLVHCCGVEHTRGHYE